MINVRSWWVLGAAVLILIGLAVNMSATTTTIHADVCPPDPLSDPNGVSPPAKVCDEPTEEPTAEPTEEPTAEPTAVPGVMRFVGTFTESGDCGPGDVVLTVSPDGSEIVSIGVANFFVAGNPFADMMVPYDPGIAIDPDDGSFSNSAPLPEPFTAITATIDGTFDFSADPPTVAGTFTAAAGDAVICDATAFSAELTDEAPEPTVAPPVTGSGPGAGSSSEALLLTLLAAGVGALALGATGMAVVRRRDA